MNKILIKKYLSFLKDNNETDYILELTNKQLDGFFVFDNKFDMEMCKKEYKRKGYHFPPNKDEEWIYMYNRFGYSANYIISYLLTNDIEYLKAWEKNYIGWKKNNIRHIRNSINHPKTVNLYSKLFSKANKLFNTTLNINDRPLDAAIRIFNLLNDFIYLKKLNCFKYLERISQKSLEQDLLYTTKYIKDNYQSKYDKSNWGIMICSYALYVLTYFNRKDDFFENKLIICLNAQILNDGGHIEFSNMYMIENILALSAYILMAKKCKKNIENVILKKYKKMVEYIYYNTSSNNYIYNVGDSDYVDVSEIMYLSYIVTKNEKYRNRIKTNLEFRFIYNELLFDDEELYCKKSKYKLLKFKKIFSDTNTYSYYDGKIDLNIVNFQGIPGHRHSDNGSFILFYKSKPIIIDSGRLTYNENSDRKMLKDKQSHNTFFLDDDCSMRYINRWKWENPYVNNRINKHENDDYDTIEVTYSDNIGNKYIRTFIIVPEKCIIIMNKVITSGEKKCTIVYNFDEKIDVKVLEKNKFDISTEAAKITLYSFSNTEEIWTLNDSYYSKNYNEKTKNCKLVNKIKAGNTIKSCQIIAFDNQKIIYNKGKLLINKIKINLNI